MMKNITINKKEKYDVLSREVKLTNGSIVILRQGTSIKNVFMVISFRDHKSRYNGDDTSQYCSLLNLDNGYLCFEERCSRKTTVNRVLNHVLSIGSSDRQYNESIPLEAYGNYDIDVLTNGTYKVDISF